MVAALIALGEVIALSCGAALGGWIGHSLTAALIGAALIQLPMAVTLLMVDDDIEFTAGAVFMLLFGSAVAAGRVGQVFGASYGWLLFAAALAVSLSVILVVRRIVGPWLDTRTKPNWRGAGSRAGARAKPSRSVPPTASVSPPTPPREGRDRNREASRDPRIRPRHKRTAGDLAFLITIAGQPRVTRPGRQTQPRPRSSSGPVTVRSGDGETEVALNSSSLVVRHKWPRPGGAVRWKVRLDLRWDDIAALGFDYGTHDSVLALWATPLQGGGRRHVVDARTLKGAQWRELAPAVAALTQGRLTIDLARLDLPGSPRDS